MKRVIVCALLLQASFGAVASEAEAKKHTRGGNDKVAVQTDHVIVVSRDWAIKNREAVRLHVYMRRASAPSYLDPACTIPSGLVHGYQSFPTYGYGTPMNKVVRGLVPVPDKQNRFYLLYFRMSDLSTNPAITHLWKKTGRYDAPSALSDAEANIYGRVHIDVAALRERSRKMKTQ